MPSREEWNRYFREYYHKKEFRNKSFSYNGKQIRLNRSIKIGVCNLCRAVWPFDTVQTQIHHEEYDDNNPTAHIIELCNRCHGTISTQQTKLRSAILRLVRKEIGYIHIKPEPKPITISGTLQKYLSSRGRT